MQPEAYPSSEMANIRFSAFSQGGLACVSGIEQSHAGRRD
jgi:hypothetical protein